jgi:nucleoside-diphosphate-sugar epimerase
MKVFLTGNRGKIGKQIEFDLQLSGHEVVGYDRLDGVDVLDLSSLHSVIKSCDAVIHLAALDTSDSPLSPEPSASDIMNVNLQGTWNVLTAAGNAHVGRVVYMSSVDTLGIFGGRGTPDYLPLDDNHPCNPASPYDISKRLAEEMCRFWSKTKHIPTICLRPPGVWTPDTYFEIQAARKVNPEYEWSPYWEFGAFIDIRDLSAASIHALTCPFEGFGCFLVAAADVTTSGKSSKELARFICPDVKWRGGSEFQENPFLSLLVTKNARRGLQWEPKYTWQSFINQGNP